MSKRSATSELNHNNWDQEEPEEEAGVFKKADQSVLEKRVIRTAKRRISASPMGESNAFSGFGGFGAGGSGGGQKTPFSFLSKTANGIGSGGKEEGMSKGGGCGQVEKGEDEGDATHSAAYYDNLRALNKSLVEWIDLHVKKNPCCILTPVFKDYEKHLESLEKEEGKAEEKGGGEAAPKPPDSGTVLPTQGFKFGGDKTPSTLLGPSPFGTFTPAPATTLSSSGGFKITNFGAAPPAKGLSFNSVFANVSAPPKTEEEEEADKDSEELPKEEFKPVTEDDALFSYRVKVYVKKEGSYAERGAGTLYVKPVPSSPSRHQVIVRADTSLGNLLVNFLLGPATPLQRVGKNNVLVVCLPTPDSKPPPVPVLIRVKTGEEADQLKEKLEALKSKQ